jgi:hypothetical protein
MRKSPVRSKEHAGDFAWKGEGGMKLSELDVAKLYTLDDATKEKILFCDCPDDGGSGDVALLLGTRHTYVYPRVEAAAKLYLDGRVRYVMPSGGVEWEIGGEQMSEALYMRQLLLEMGVPDERILLENEARSTKENMICGTLQMYRRLKLEDVRKVYIVSSELHMRRALAFAKNLLPRSIEIAPFAAWSGVDCRANWKQSVVNRTYCERSLPLIKKEVDSGGIPDIEI